MTCALPTAYASVRLLRPRLGHEERGNGSGGAKSDDTAAKGTGPSNCGSVTPILDLELAELKETKLSGPQGAEETDASTQADKATASKQVSAFHCGQLH